ncbi:hypothetical protein RJT34_32427 [Clitoria ternatea]|uniref:Nbr1 FW domain-containing protein n=1 Tax=Clitoria ternatea TaxID=43366 RepID=A0AAN9EWY2_CLITE
MGAAAAVLKNRKKEAENSSTILVIRKEAGILVLILRFTLKTTVKKIMTSVTFSSLKWVMPFVWSSCPFKCTGTDEELSNITTTKVDSQFILDVNVIDGTMMAPSTAFTKIWWMRNGGTLVWPQGTQLVWIGGNMFRLGDSMLEEEISDARQGSGEAALQLLSWLAKK